MTVNTFHVFLNSAEHSRKLRHDNTYTIFLSPRSSAGSRRAHLSVSGESDVQ